MNNDTTNNFAADHKWTDAGSGRSNHNIWSSDTSLSNAYFRGGNDGDSSYTSPSYTAIPNQHISTRNDSRGNVLSTAHLESFDVNRSMNRLSIQPQESQHYFPNGIVSVPSMTSASGTSVTVPGIVGVSSASTGGSTTRSSSTFNDPSAGHPRQMSYLSQPFYPTADSAKPKTQYKATSTSHVRDEESVDSRVDNNRTSGYRRNQRKGRPNWRNNKSSQSWSGRGKGREECYRDGTDGSKSPLPAFSDDYTAVSSQASSEAIRMLMGAPASTSASLSSSQASGLTGNRLPLDRLVESTPQSQAPSGRPILPAIEDVYAPSYGDDDLEESLDCLGDDGEDLSPITKKKEWLLRMNRRMNDIPVGQLDPVIVPIAAIMNAWAKTKSSQGASMVEMWLKRIQEEADAGNTKVVPNTKLYTMAGKFSAALLFPSVHLFLTKRFL